VKRHVGWPCALTVARAVAPQARGVLYVTTGTSTGAALPSYRVHAIAVHSAAQRRAARAYPLLRVWALAQRGRARLTATSPRSPGGGSAVALARRLLGDGDDGNDRDDDDRDDGGGDGDDGWRLLRRGGASGDADERPFRETLRLLAEHPVFDTLALVLSFLTGDSYRILKSSSS